MMILRQLKYWINAVIINPRTIKWYFHWQSSLGGRRSPLGDELPWVTYEAIDWLDSHLTKEMTIFEWGSGGSTLFFAQRVKQVITVEHDPLWYQEVTHTLERMTYKNILFNLVEPERSENMDTWYKATSEIYKDYSFERYIKAIDAYPDDFFDVVFVDGRARPGCMKQALPKIKRGGYLILDNSDRTIYNHGQALVDQWRSVPKCGPGPYVDYPTCTTIWQSPF